MNAMQIRKQKDALREQIDAVIKAIGDDYDYAAAGDLLDGDDKEAVFKAMMDEHDKLEGELANALETQERVLKYKSVNQNNIAPVTSAEESDIRKEPAVEVKKSAHAGGDALRQDIAKAIVDMRNSGFSGVTKLDLSTYGNTVAVSKAALDVSRPIMPGEEDFVTPLRPALRVLDVMPSMPGNDASHFYLRTQERRPGGGTSSTNTAEAGRGTEASAITAGQWRRRGYSYRTLRAVQELQREDIQDDPRYEQQTVMDMMFDANNVLETQICQGTGSVLAAGATETSETDQLVGLGNWVTHNTVLHATNTPAADKKILQVFKNARTEVEKRIDIEPNVIICSHSIRDQIQAKLEGLYFAQQSVSRYPNVSLYGMLVIPTSKLVADTLIVGYLDQRTAQLGVRSAWDVETSYDAKRTNYQVQLTLAGRYAFVVRYVDAFQKVSVTNLITE